MNVTMSSRIQAAMDAKRMKAVDICEKTGIPKSSMSMYLSGKVEPKSDRLYKLAKCLDVSEAWLLGYDVPKERPSEFSIPSQIDTLRIEIKQLKCEIAKLPEGEVRDELEASLYIKEEQLDDLELVNSWSPINTDSGAKDQFDELREMCSLLSEEKNEQLLQYARFLCAQEK